MRELAQDAHVGDAAPQACVLVALRAHQHERRPLERDQDAGRLEVHREVGQPAGVRRPEGGPVIRVSHQQVQVPFGQHLLDPVPTIGVFLGRDGRSRLLLGRHRSLLQAPSCPAGVARGARHAHAGMVRCGCPRVKEPSVSTPEAEVDLLPRLHPAGVRSILRAKVAVQRVLDHGGWSDMGRWLMVPTVMALLLGTSPVSAAPPGPDTGDWGGAILAQTEEVPAMATGVAVGPAAMVVGGGTGLRAHAGRRHRALLGSALGEHRRQHVGGRRGPRVRAGPGTLHGGLERAGGRHRGRRPRAGRLRGLRLGPVRPGQPGGHRTSLA